jgi:hypothetical protein
VFPLPPIVAAALAGFAALIATYLPRPAWLVRTLDGVAAATPFGWYLLGVVLGPGLGLLDTALLDAGTPALACAIGWIAARAGATLAAPRPPEERRDNSALAVAGLALVIPAALLYGAGRFLPAALAPDWKPLPAVIATLAAALVVAGAADTRSTTAALLAATGALASLLPHAHRADAFRAAAWAGYAIGGAAISAIVAAQLARRAPSHFPATVAGVGLAAGIGLASGTSPILVCALTGAALARWSPAHVRLAVDLRATEPVASAALWIAAGAMFGGALLTVVIAAALLSLLPLVRRLFIGTAASDYALGLAIVLSFTITAATAIGPLGRAILTAGALALLLSAAVPAFKSSARLTSRHSRPEVSA